MAKGVDRPGYWIGFGQGLVDWQRELGQLDAHFNEDPEPEKHFMGCQFVEIDCLYECGDRLQRCYICTSTKLNSVPNVHSAMSTATTMSPTMVM